MTAAKTILILVFVLSFVVVPNSVPAAEGNSDSMILLAPRVSIFSTPDALSIDAVIQLEKQGRFLSAHAINQVFVQHAKDYYWLKFSVDSSNLLQKPFLVLGGDLIFKCALYGVVNGTVQNFGETGSLVPYARQNDFSFMYYYQLPAKNNLDLYLLMDSRKHSLQVIPVLVSKRQFHFIERKAYTTYGIFTGILLLTAFFNLFLYFFIRDKVHLVYFFYALSNWLLLLSIRNIDYQFLYPSFHFASLINRMFYACCSAMLQIVIMQKLLNQRKTDLFFWPATVIKWLNVLCIPFVILSELGFLNALLPFRTYIFFIIILSDITVIIASSIEKVLQRLRLAIIYLIAVILMLAGAVEVILINLNLLQIVRMPPNMFEMGIVIESFIIFLALLYRYNLFKKENDQLILTMQQQKDGFTRELLHTQEMEQKRIAQELHDELGGNLAALKMVIQNFKIPNEQYELANKLIDKTSSNARDIAHNLMPPDFDSTDLKTLLSTYYNHLNRYGNIAFQYYYSGMSLLNKQEELMVYRIIMELTNNIIKHAAATEATIQLIFSDDAVEIMTEDNGTGMSKSSRFGFGLNNIQSRINYMNGSLVVDSGESGSVFIIKIPVRNEQ